MYEQYQEKALCGSQTNSISGQLDRNPTVEENIDAKINMLKKEIERLEESKKTLTPLLSMHIRDIREAMSY